MTVGCPKEIKVQENRVALTPAGAGQLVRRNVSVLVQREAGVGADYLASEYLEAGTEIVDSAEEIFARSGSSG